MTRDLNIDRAVLQQWITEKIAVPELRERLSLLGFDEDAIREKLKEFKKLSNAAKQFKGFLFLCGGAFLGFISCVLTLMNPFPDLYYWILYGLTSVAITLMLVGLYVVFE